MEYEIVPQIGYGPIKFGMKIHEVREILGAPCKTAASISPNETDEEEIEFYGDQMNEWYGQSFPEPTKPQITYLHDKVVVICIFRQSGTLIYKGMDLHERKKRDDVLEALAKDEDEYFYNEENFYFPKSGLIVPIAKYAKDLFYIILVHSDYMTSRLEYKMYEPSTALDG